MRDPLSSRSGLNPQPGAVNAPSPVNTPIGEAIVSPVGLEPLSLPLRILWCARPRGGGDSHLRVVFLRFLDSFAASG
jgi:hypothetical protein